MAFVIKKQHSKQSGNTSTHTGKKSIIKLWGLLIKSLNSKHTIKKKKQSNNAEEENGIQFAFITLYQTVIYFTYLPFVCWCFLILHLLLPTRQQGCAHPDEVWCGCTATALVSLSPSVTARALHQWPGPSLRTPAGRISRHGTKCTTDLELKL